MTFFRFTFEDVKYTNFALSYYYKFKLMIFSEELENVYVHCGVIKPMEVL